MLIINFVNIYKRWMKKNEEIHHSFFFISVFDWGSETEQTIVPLDR